VTASTATTEEQIADALREVEGRTTSCRRLSADGGQRSHLLHLEKKYGHLGVTELRRLRQLEDENNRL